MKYYYVYLLANITNTVIYTGVTRNLIRRVYQHKNNLVPGFTKKYRVHKLVYYEVFESVENTLNREKQIKAGSRRKKIKLIENTNRNWDDLYNTIGH